MKSSETAEPVHNYFGLSYCEYAVQTRTILQSMPLEWQQRFIACLEELDAASADLSSRPYMYSVKLHQERGETTDPYADYERGRRRVELKGAP